MDEGAAEGLYDDLEDTDLGEQIHKLERSNEKLNSHIRNLEGDIAKLMKEVVELKRTQETLTKNISELFKTAQAEIQRKDSIIADLRSKLDDVILRRVGTKRPPHNNEQNRDSKRMKPNETKIDDGKPQNRSDNALNAKHNGDVSRRNDNDRHRRDENRRNLEKRRDVTRKSDAKEIKDRLADIRDNRRSRSNSQDNRLENRNKSRSRNFGGRRRYDERQNFEGRRSRDGRCSKNNRVPGDGQRRLSKNFRAEVNNGIANRNPDEEIERKPRRKKPEEMEEGEISIIESSGDECTVISFECFPKVSDARTSVDNEQIKSTHIENLQGKPDETPNVEILEVQIPQEAPNVDGSKNCPDLEVRDSQQVAIRLEYQSLNGGNELKLAGNDSSSSNNVTVGNITDSSLLSAGLNTTAGANVRRKRRRCVVQLNDD